jgi:dihydroflavonol-4-reductase
MIAAITGADGLVGANLVRDLLGRGRTVRALVYEPNDALTGLPVEIVRADVLDESSLARAFAGAAVVYHLAAHIALSPRHDAALTRVNVDGTRHVVRACLAQGVRRLIHFSSIHALSPHPLDGIVDGERPLLGDGCRQAVSSTAEGTPYDWSKAAAEREVLGAVARGLDAVIIAPTAILGPHDCRPSLMGRTLADFFEGRLRFLVAGGFNWVDVRDVTSAAIAAEARGVAGRRYIVGGRWTTMRELADLAGEVSGRAIRRVEVPMAAARPAAGLSAGLVHAIGRETRFTPRSLLALRCYRHVGCAEAARDLDYRPRPLRDTLEAVYGWLQTRRGR